MWLSANLNIKVRVQAARLFVLAGAVCLLFVTTSGAFAGPKLLVTLEQGTGLIGGPSPSVNGASVSATRLQTASSTAGQTVVGTTDANGKLVLEVSHIGAYAIEIRLEGSTGPRFWSSRKVLLAPETELVADAALSTDDFGPIEDYTQVSCSVAAQDAETHPVREILLGRLSVLRTEINTHRNFADMLAKTRLSDAPSALREEITAVLAMNGTSAEIFDALTPIRQRSGLPNSRVGTTGRFPEESTGDASPPGYTWDIETIWLSYFLAARATAELDALYVNLQQCEGSTVAETSDADGQVDTQEQDAPVEQVQVPGVTPKQARLPVPVQYDQVLARPVRQPEHTGTLPSSAADDVIDWTGAYIGGHLGAGFADGRYRAGIAGPGIPVNVDADGVLGGILAGYNLQYDQIVFGLEGDVSFGNVRGRTTLAGISNPRVETDFIATIRTRVGYAWDRVLVFGQVGIGFADVQVKESLQLGAPARTDKTHIGVIVGGGIEWALTDTVNVRTDYTYGSFDRRSHTVGPATDTLAFDVHIIRAAISIKLGRLP